MSSSSRRMPYCSTLQCPESQITNWQRRLRINGFQDALIVAISGYGDTMHVERSIEAGIDQHLLKPVEFATIQHILSNHLKREANRTGS